MARWDRTVCRDKEWLMKRHARALRLNADLAKAAWGELPQMKLKELEELTQKYSLSVALGDVQYLDRGWYVTHAGLLRLALRRGCAGIRVHQVREFCDPTCGRWVFKATVYKSPRSKGFAGYGDADPSNVSLLVHGAEMRVAETRAVNRALRKAYGIGLCSVEEMGSYSPAIEPAPQEAERLSCRRCERLGQRPAPPA
jgi:hypothetical protein